MTIQLTQLIDSVTDAPVNLTGGYQINAITYHVGIASLNDAPTEVKGFFKSIKHNEVIVFHENLFGKLLSDCLPGIASPTDLVFQQDKLVGIFSRDLEIDSPASLKQTFLGINNIKELSDELRKKMGKLFFVLYLHEAEDAHDEQFLLNENDIVTFDYDRFGYHFMRLLGRKRGQPYCDAGYPFDINSTTLQTFPNVTAGYYWPATHRVFAKKKGYTRDFICKFQQLQHDENFQAGMNEQVDCFIEQYKDNSLEQIYSQCLLKTMPRRELYFKHYQRKAMKLACLKGRVSGYYQTLARQQGLLWDGYLLDDPNKVSSELDLWRKG